MLDIHEWIDLLARLYDRYGYIIVFLGSLGENTAALGLVLPGGCAGYLGYPFKNLALYSHMETLSPVF